MLNCEKLKSVIDRQAADGKISGAAAAAIMAAGIQNYKIARETEKAALLEWPLAGREGLSVWVPKACLPYEDGRAAAPVPDPPAWTRSETPPDTAFPPEQYNTAPAPFVDPDAARRDRIRAALEPLADVILALLKEVKK